MKRSLSILFFAILSVFMFIGISEARWYNPEMGRFLSEDPIGFAGGVNFYGITLLTVPLTLGIH